MAASKKDVAKQQVKEDREKVREMYLSGKTVKEIAKETYFSSSYCYAMVRDLAKEKNLAKKAKRAPLDEAMIQDAKAGMTVAEIAKKHGVTYQQCYYTVSEFTVCFPEILWPCQFCSWPDTAEHRQSVRLRKAHALCSLC